MATMRLHPCLYRPTAYPIGQTTPQCPRPLGSYSLLKMSINITTPLDTEASTTNFPANLFASFCCLSEPLHNTIGPAHSVLQKCGLLLVPQYNPVQNARAARPPSSVSYYITSTCAKRRLRLVNRNVTRASSVNTKKPIGSSTGSRVPHKSQEPLPTSSTYWYIRISVFETRCSAAIFTCGDTQCYNRIIYNRNLYNLDLSEKTPHISTTNASEIKRIH